MLLDGKKYAEAKLPELKERVSQLEKEPRLAILQVFGDDASDRYVQNISVTGIISKHLKDC